MQPAAPGYGPGSGVGAGPGPAQAPGILQEGQVIGGRFTVGVPLAQELIGPVFSAQRSDGIKVTLQVIAPARLASSEAVRRADREVRVAQALRHPHIFSIGELLQAGNGVLFVVREHLAGETLEARMRRVGRPPVEAAFTLFEQVASALASAHRKGLFHHHLGPHKIFLHRVEGQAGDITRLCDLGLLRLFTLEQPRDLLACPARPSYLAPEQVVHPRGASAAADVYALGVLLFELLAGRAPFLSQDPDVLLSQHVNDKPPTLADKAPDRLFSAELEGLLAMMLAKSPQGRPKDAQAVLERLGRLRQAGDLVIALDEREAQLIGQWPLLPQAAAAAALGLPAEPVEEGVPELPQIQEVAPPPSNNGAVPRRRAPTPAPVRAPGTRPTATTGSRPVVGAPRQQPAAPRSQPHRIVESRRQAPPSSPRLDPRSAPDGYAPTGAQPIVAMPPPASLTPGLDRVLAGGRSQVSAPQPAPRMATAAQTPGLDRVFSGGPPVAGGQTPISAALSDPAPAAAAPGAEAAAPGAPGAKVSWLRRPVVIRGRKLPRGALLGAGLCALLSGGVLLWALMVPPEVHVTRRPPPRRLPAGARAAANRPAPVGVGAGDKVTGGRAPSGPGAPPARVGAPGATAPAGAAAVRGTGVPPAGAAAPAGATPGATGGRGPGAPPAGAVTSSAQAAPGATAGRGTGAPPAGVVASSAQAAGGGRGPGAPPAGAVASSAQAAPAAGGGRGTGAPPSGVAAPVKGGPGAPPAAPASTGKPGPGSAATPPHTAAPPQAAAPRTAATPTPAATPPRTATPTPRAAPPQRTAVTPPRTAAPPPTRSATPAERPARAAKDPARPPRAHARTEEVAPGAVTVRITSLPAGAQVLRDGQVLGTTPFSEAIPRGERALSYQVQRIGYETARVEIQPTRDQQVQLDLSPNMGQK